MKTFMKSFLENVTKFPQRSAVMDKTGSYSYEELNHKSNVLAQNIINLLKEKNIDIPKLRSEGKNGVRIAVLLPRTKDYEIAFLAVLRLGCALIPIDAEYPKERIQNILDDGNPEILLSIEPLLQTKQGLKAKQIVLWEEMLSAPHSSSIPNYDFSSPELEGFLFYTSGSTGKPKGVIQTQNLVNQFFYLKSNLLTSSNINFCCIASFVFSSSLYTLYPPLIVGAGVYIADNAEIQSPSELYNIIVSQNIVSMFIPPKLYNAMTAVYGPLPLKFVILSGEKFIPEDDIKNILVDVYGATETSSVLRRVYNDPSSSYSIMYPNVTVYILDEDGQKIDQPGIPGELCVVSPFLAEGYNNRPEDTAARFVGCPFEPGKKMFRTGDYFSWTKDNLLKFHGRSDRMVKLRGYRIELDEIEKIMHSIPEIKEAAVILKNINNSDQICCYYTSKNKENLTSDYLHSALAKHLPMYMQPAFFIELPKLPLNTFGKIDYVLLSSFEIKRLQYIAPSTETEKFICRAFAFTLNIPEENISVLDDFFSLGGDSLKTALLITQLNFPECSILTILKLRTIKNIAAWYEENKQKESELTDWSNLNRLAREEELELSDDQINMLDYQLYTPMSTMWNLAVLFRIGKNVELDRFIKAVETALKAHPILYSKIIINENQEFRLKYDPELMTPIVPELISEEAFLELRENLNTPFILENSKLFCCRVFKTKFNTYFFFNVHHIISDGTSFNLLVKDIIKSYNGEALMEDFVFLHFKEAGQLRNSAAASKYSGLLKKKFDNVNWTKCIKPDFESRENQIGYVNEEIPFSKEILHDILAKYQLSENIFFMTVTLLTMAKIEKRNDVFLFSTFNGRNDLKSLNIFGTLIKEVPIGVRLNRAMPILSLFQSVRNQANEMYTAANTFIYDFENNQSGISDELCFIYQPNIYLSKTLNSLSLKPIELPNNFNAATALFTVEIINNDYDEDLTLQITYMSTRYEKTTVLNFAREYLKTAVRIVEHIKENITVDFLLS